MEAMEFRTIIKEDGTIELPDQYKNLRGEYLRVILLKEDNISTKETVAQHYSKVKEIINQIQD